MAVQRPAGSLHTGFNAKRPLTTKGSGLLLQRDTAEHVGQCDGSEDNAAGKRVAGWGVSTGPADCDLTDTLHLSPLSAIRQVTRL